MSCKKLTILLFSLLLLIIGSITLYAKGHRFLKTDIVSKGQQIHYFFKPGDTIKSLAECLHEKGNLKYPTYLVLYAKLRGITKNLKAGEYYFEGPLTARQILHQVTHAKVVQHKITFIEGWTFNQFLDQLNQDNIITHSLNKLTTKQQLTLLNIKKDFLEGLFFPDTYQYIYGNSDISILQGAHRLLQQQLKTQWQLRAANLPYQSPYQALIVASLIQKEATLPSEDPIIASVIINRLKKNMYLQIDPTVIYALGSSYTNKITSADLKVKSPFNTYIHKGLPPSPICMPGLIAIEAALHPALTHYYYFVAKGDGSHEFSETLQQQDQAIEQYILKKPRRKTTNEHKKT